MACLTSPWNDDTRLLLWILESDRRNAEDALAVAAAEDRRQYGPNFNLAGAKHGRLRETIGAARPLQFDGLWCWRESGVFLRDVQVVLLRL